MKGRPVHVQARAPGWLDEASHDRLRRNVTQALRRARQGGGATVLASVTAQLSGTVDPSAVICAARRPGEPWQCLEQPDRDGAAIAGAGCAAELTASGPDRFTDVARQWRELVARAVADDPAGVDGAGLTALGGFSFAPGPGGGRQWAPFAPASLIVPELLLARRGDRCWLTVTAAVDADDTVEEICAHVAGRLGDLSHAALPMLDPAPTGAYEVRSAMPAAHYEEAVTRAVQRIQAGELEKIVLAREVEVHAPRDHDPAAVLGVLRDGFRSCYVYAVGRGAAAFVGATPELLIRREGQRASTVALAGSIRRSADPGVDDHLAEQLRSHGKDREENAIVARRIVRELAPLSVWVTAAPEPAVIRVANIQHLAAPIRAQLAEPVSVLELAGRLHPTPAIGGEPSAVAQRLIPALEGFDRGWYAGAVGWVDQTDDGEFCVALRCALLTGRTAACYAGCGIVAESDPASELAETEVKLGALLPVLAG